MHVSSTKVNIPVGDEIRLVWKYSGDARTCLYVTFTFVHVSCEHTKLQPWCSTLICLPNDIQVFLNYSLPFLFLYSAFHTAGLHHADSLFWNSQLCWDAYVINILTFNLPLLLALFVSEKDCFLWSITDADTLLDSRIFFLCVCVFFSIAANQLNIVRGRGAGCWFCWTELLCLVFLNAIFSSAWTDTIAQQDTAFFSWNEKKKS